MSMMVGGAYKIRPLEPVELKKMNDYYRVEIDSAQYSENRDKAAVVGAMFSAFKEQYQNSAITEVGLRTRFCFIYKGLIEQYLAFPDTSYALITPEQLPLHRATIQGGCLVPLTPFSRESGCSPASSKDVSFVISCNESENELELYVSDNKRHKHSSFLHGEDVAAAGEMTVEFDGDNYKIMRISNLSGHYKPEEPQTHQLVAFLKQARFSPSNHFQFVVRATCGVVESCGTFHSLDMDEKPDLDKSQIKPIAIIAILERNDFLDFLKDKTIECGPDFDLFNSTLVNSTFWRKYRGYSKLTNEEFIRRYFWVKEFAKTKLGVTVKDLKPSLVPLAVTEKEDSRCA